MTWSAQCGTTYYRLELSVSGGLGGIVMGLVAGSEVFP